jgi:hypothetical protein
MLSITAAGTQGQQGWIAGGVGTRSALTNIIAFPEGGQTWHCTK